MFEQLITSATLGTRTFPVIVVLVNVVVQNQRGVYNGSQNVLLCTSPTGNRMEQQISLGITMGSTNKAG